MTIHTGYNPLLVTLSVVIAIFASYTALDLGARAREASPWPRAGWLAAASLAMGGGIWSMHFVGMLAFEMAMPVRYETGLTLLSLAIAVGVTGAAFAWVGRRGARRRDVALSGPLMGLGVAAMHYTGMMGLRIPANLAYSPPVVAASVAIAITAATAALWLTFRHNGLWQRMLAATVMGVAVAGMHYTGMAAATFTLVQDGDMGALHGPVGVVQQNLALYVAGATFLILFLAMLASSVEQQRTQNDLLASEERFRAAAEAVGDIIWTNDPRGRMGAPQPDWERFTGQPEAAYVGHGWAAAIHPEDRGPTLEAWNAAVAARSTFVFEHRLRRHDGVYRLFAVRGVPVLDRAGAIREWVGVHDDITDRRAFETTLAAARDEAEQANRAKSIFLANMSHEFRTPLTAIIGYTEMLLDDAAGQEDGTLAQDLGKVDANARHLLGLVNDVLDLSKIESGRMEVSVDRFNLAATVRDVAGTAGMLLAKNNNTFVLDLPADLGVLEQDLAKVRQILLNLLSNAAKFTHGGTVRLVAGREQENGRDEVRIAVVDTGIGMSPEQLGRIFQQFQQADESTTRRFGGTGLGLSISLAFATMMGGTITVASAPGQGTTFTLVLPDLYVDPGEAPSAGAPVPVPRLRVVA